ncbi:MAG: hypothetical protein RL685_1278 [Pseudomonadota bacterium]
MSAVPRRPWSYLWLALLGCGPSSAADLGLDAALRVEDGDFFRGASPSDAGGPNVLGAFLTQTRFPVGKQRKSFTGVLASGATSAAVGLTGDVGYWLVGAGFPPPEAADSPSFDAPLSFSEDLPPGEHTLWVAAADARGHFGPPVTASVTLTEPEPPSGELVVSLAWDSPSDLDLHLVIPDGTEVFHGNVNSWQSSGVTPPLDESWRSGGILDFDSNAECRIDGRNQENIVWTVAPPAGRYSVRVDTRSLCASASARWLVEVWRQGERQALARGFSPTSATRFGHERGAGVLALEFDVP